MIQRKSLKSLAHRSGVEFKDRVARGQSTPGLHVMFTKNTAADRVKADCTYCSVSRFTVISHTEYVSRKMHRPDEHMIKDTVYVLLVYLYCLACGVLNSTNLLSGLCRTNNRTSIRIAWRQIVSANFLIGMSATI